MSLEKEIKAHLKEIDKIENRGVKAGQKRGPYKKKNKSTENGNNNVTVDHNSDPAITNTESKKASEANNSAYSEQSESKVIEQNNDPVIKDAEIISETKQETSAPAFQQVDDSDLLKEFLETNSVKDEFKPQSEKDQKKAESARPIPDGVKKLINGRMLLRFCDVLFPTVIIKLGGIFNKDLKLLKGRDIRLTNDQHEDLRELADEVAVMVFQKIDPLQAFILMLGVNYYYNALGVIDIKKAELIKLENQKKNENS